MEKQEKGMMSHAYMVNTSLCPHSDGEIDVDHNYFVFSCLTNTAQLFVWLLG